jgi:hypothetical protein
VPGIKPTRLLAILAAGLVAGCGQEAPSEAQANAVAAVERYHPRATDVQCGETGDTAIECTAMLDGERVTFQATATADAVILNSTPGQ